VLVLRLLMLSLLVLVALGLPELALVV